MQDVVILGGGPAGLSAALVLGRCRRDVVLIDEGRPRNERSRGLNGYLTRDGIEPAAFRELAWEELRSYPTVQARQGVAIGARRLADRFEVALAGGEVLHARKLLLATGVTDVLPDIPGLRELWGRSAFTCPYCDGWEVRDQPVAVYGRGSDGRDFAIELKGWTGDVTWVTNGETPVSGEDRARLGRLDVGLREEVIERLEANDDALERIIFRTGDPLPRRALFVLPEPVQRCGFVEGLGCELKGGLVQVGSFQAAGVEGLYVAGDAARSVHLSIVAAAEGAEAAFAINMALLKADLR